ncbi:MAG: phosphoribosylanthranilate isomerase [Anaerolineaceae bacterium]|jgi:phosphoribosylanthranilate isomerase|nr:MAG: phosphoribosylanthranilate isomerase [Anaerolineaceae bacterium]
MNMIIQIYAFTDPGTALAAANLGVNHIGFVAGKYGVVPAELDFFEAREIAASLPPQTTAVALTMAEDINEILHMAAEVKPSIVHISSDLECVGIEAMRDLRSRLDKNIRLMKAIPVVDESSIVIAQQFAAVSDLLLLDTKKEGFPGVGATGFTHDWNISRRIVETVGIPVILAGGLTAKNVGAAIRAIHPWGVDSNTSTNKPGSNTDKDLDLIADFVNAIRSGEEPVENGEAKA